MQREQVMLLEVASIWMYFPFPHLKLSNLQESTAESRCPSAKFGTRNLPNFGAGFSFQRHTLRYSLPCPIACLGDLGNHTCSLVATRACPCTPPATLRSGWVEAGCTWLEWHDSG